MGAGGTGWSRAAEAERRGEPLTGDSQGGQALAAVVVSKKRSEASKPQDLHPEQTETNVLSPAWLQDQPSIQGASTAPEPRVTNRRRLGKKRRPWSPRSQHPAGSLQGWGAARRCHTPWGRGPPSYAPSARILGADRRFKRPSNGRSVSPR